MSDLQDDGCSQQPDWLSLDDLIMEKVFEYLPLRGRFNASLVCSSAVIISEGVVERKEYRSRFSFASGVPSLVYVLSITENLAEH